MAVDSRANNTILINNNLPDNVIEAITPALHRDVEYNLNDSNYNKVDEPRKYVLSFNVNSDSTVSLLYTEDEPIIIDTASEVITQNLDNAYYQVSTDGVNWVDAFDPPAVGNATIVDLANWISTNITSGTVFSIRAIGVYGVAGFGEANIKFNFKYFN